MANSNQKDPDPSRDVQASQAPPNVPQPEQLAQNQSMPTFPQNLTPRFVQTVASIPHARAHVAFHNQSQGVVLGNAGAPNQAGIEVLRAAQFQAQPSPHIFIAPTSSQHGSIPRGIFVSQQGGNTRPAGQQQGVRQNNDSGATPVQWVQTPMQATPRPIGYIQVQPQQMYSSAQGLIRATGYIPIQVPQGYFQLGQLAQPRALLVRPPGHSQVEDNSSSSNATALGTTSATVNNKSTLGSGVGKVKGGEHDSLSPTGEKSSQISSSTEGKTEAVEKVSGRPSPSGSKKRKAAPSIRTTQKPSKLKQKKVVGDKNSVQANAVPKPKLGDSASVFPRKSIEKTTDAKKEDDVQYGPKPAKVQEVFEAQKGKLYISILKGPVSIFWQDGLEYWCMLLKIHCSNSIFYALDEVVADLSLFKYSKGKADVAGPIAFDLVGPEPIFNIHQREAVVLFRPKTRCAHYGTLCVAACARGIPNPFLKVFSVNPSAVLPRDWTADKVQRYLTSWDSRVRSYRSFVQKLFNSAKQCLMEFKIAKYLTMGELSDRLLIDFYELRNWMSTSTDKMDLTCNSPSVRTGFKVYSWIGKNFGEVQVAVKKDIDWPDKPAQKFNEYDMFPIFGGSRPTNMGTMPLEKLILRAKVQYFKKVMRMNFREVINHAMLHKYRVGYTTDNLMKVLGPNDAVRKGYDFMNWETWHVEGVSVEKFDAMIEEWCRITTERRKILPYELAELRKKDSLFEEIVRLRKVSRLCKLRPLRSTRPALSKPKLPNIPKLEKLLKLSDSKTRVQKLVISERLATSSVPETDAINACVILAEFICPLESSA